MHKLVCSQCLQRVNVLIPPLSNRRLSCSHVRPYSRWFALYEDVTPVDIPISEIPPSSSTYSHEAPIGLNDPSSSVLRRLALVPTLADSSELGGRDIVDEDVAAQGVSSGSPIGSIYDTDSMLATFEESNLEIGNAYFRDVLPLSTNNASLPIGRTIVPEKDSAERRSTRVQGVRSRLRSMSTTGGIAAPSALVVPKIEEKEEGTTSGVETIQEEHIMSDVPVRVGEAAVQDLMNAIEQSDMTELRSLLANSYWPRAKLDPYQVSRIFSFIIDKAKDCEECREIMRDFACSSFRHSLPSHIPILFATRSAREEGVPRALEALQFHHKSFILTPISLRFHSYLRSESIRSLWNEVTKRSSEADISEMYETGVTMGLVKGSRELVEETLKEKRRSGASFTSIFCQWKTMGERYGNPRNGMAIVVRRAMEEEEKMRFDSLLSIATFVSNSPSLHTESFMVHLVLNLLCKGEEKAAKHIFSLISIHGKHWYEILGDLERDQSSESLVLVEKIANIITYGVIGELRKKERKKKVDISAEVPMIDVKENEKEMKIVEKDELSVMMESIVWSANGGKNDRKKKGAWKAKKRVKVDQKEMHELTERIQKTWLQLEMTMNGSSSEGMNRLVSWSMLHRLAVPDSISHLVPSNETNRNVRESDV